MCGGDVSRGQFLDVVCQTMVTEAGMVHVPKVWVLVSGMISSNNQVLTHAMLAIFDQTLRYEIYNVP
jgi:Na+/H+-dicarboxylate symporter